MHSPQRHSTISVIVPVRNAAADLRLLLACLDRQTVGRSAFDVVIGDDGSTDGTASVATADGHVRVLPGPPRNAYAARNRAVRASSGSVLAFCDADCRPEPEWLERGLAALASADLAAGRIRFDIPPGAGIWSLLDAESTKDHRRQVQLGVAETANLFVSRRVLDRVGLFDEAQAGYGDFELVQRCVATGARLVFAPAAVVSHPVRASAGAFLRNVWSMNASYGAFEARAGRVPEGVRLREWVPVVQAARARRRLRMSPGLDRTWMAANGVRPRLAQDACAIPLNYVFLPYYRSLAQVRGWWRGRSERGGASPAAR